MRNCTHARDFYMSDRVMNKDKMNKSGKACRTGKTSIEKTEHSQRKRERVVKFSLFHINN